MRISDWSSDVCSSDLGRFRRGMKLTQVQTGKTIAVHSPIFFFAQSRELADEAFPGDIICIPIHGVLRVGDTLTEGEQIRFTGLRSFAPEILRRSEERRVGKEGVSRCRSRWSPSPSQQNTMKNRKS